MVQIHTHTHGERREKNHFFSEKCDFGFEYLYFVPFSAVLRHTDNNLSSHIVCYLVFVTKTDEVAISSVFSIHS